MAEFQEFKCKICEKVLSNLKFYTDHIKLLQNISNFNFPCPFPTCQRKYTKASSLRAHIASDHGKVVNKLTLEHSRLTSLNCNVPFCEQTCNESSDLIAHLQAHIRKNYTVLCLYGCGKFFSKRSAHLSHKHRYMAQIPERSYSIQSTSAGNSAVQEEKLAGTTSDELKVQSANIYLSLAQFCLRLINWNDFPKEILLRKTARGSLECINWQPVDLPLGETKESQHQLKSLLVAEFEKNQPDAEFVEAAMNKTYATQRFFINSKRSITEVRKEWPFLLNEKYILFHFEALVGKDILKLFWENLPLKCRKIYEFMRCQNSKQRLSECVKHIDHSKERLQNSTPEILGAFLLLLASFEEDERFFFRFLSVFAEINPDRGTKCPKNKNIAMKEVLNLSNKLMCFQNIFNLPAYSNV